MSYRGFEDAEALRRAAKAARDDGDIAHARDLEARARHATRLAREVNAGISEPHGTPWDSPDRTI